MKITIVQTKLYWEEPSLNLQHFDSLFEKIDHPTDLVVLPEMFSTGFSMNPEKTAEPHRSRVFGWLQKKAAQKKAVVTGSVAIEENNRYYNRLHWMEPDGNCDFYDKRHLFRMAKEDEVYVAGTKKIIKTLNGFKILPLVCYDLRFPVWSRNGFNKTNSSWDYDILLYVANWPEARRYPWQQLLIARAIENQCYVVGVNRIGQDGNGYAHSGDSVVINPRGEIISNTKAHEESIETVAIDRTYLEEFRRIFPVGLDTDDFVLK